MAKTQWSKISEENAGRVMAQIQELNSQLRSIPYSDPMDTEYRRVVYVRYADDFLIGVIGSKEDARQVKSDVGAFIRSTFIWRCHRKKRSSPSAMISPVFSDI